MGDKSKIYANLRYLFLKLNMYDNAKKNHYIFDTNKKICRYVCFFEKDSGYMLKIIDCLYFPGYF